MKQATAILNRELSRREFMRLALISSAMLAGSGGLLEASASETNGAVQAHGAFRPLAPGAVRPEGWLRGQLQRQAEHLGSKLPEISWPFTGKYWAGEEKGESWWPWEQKAYWLDGATRLSIVLQDENLMAQVRASLDYTLTHATPEGYLGPMNFAEPTEAFHRWPHTVFFRGLTALADASPDTSPALGAPQPVNIAEALRKHYLNDKASYGAPERNVTNIESILWCYERTGDPQLLLLAENAWLTYQTAIAANPSKYEDDLSELRVYSAAAINAHGVTYAEIAKLPAILYLYTGKQEYLKFAQAAQRRIFDHHMLIDGVPSTSEWYRTVTSLDSHETCDIADHTWSWGYMLMATGESRWADHIERACFNAAPGAIKNDWKALQYFSCPNQFLATLNSDHNVMEHGGEKMAFQPNPGKRTACCGGDVHRIFPNYTIRMWMKSDDGGLAAVLYGPSRVKTTVGANHQSVGQPVEIVQTTDYPFHDRIVFTVNTESPVVFPLSLRVPNWCSAPRLEVNGAPVSTARDSAGFLVVRRSFKQGDTITLTLPMKLAVTEWPQNGIGIEHGPLLYAMPIEANWTTKVEKNFSTEEYPSWEATPKSEWNYGLAIDPAQRDPAKLEGAVRIDTKPGIAENPWESPATTLNVPVRKIEDWELQVNPSKPAQRFTPPLPDLSCTKVSETVERITLVPYGSTQLRMTIFPKVKA